MSFKRERKYAGDELKAYALRLLAGRPLSVAELRERLRRRAEIKTEVDAVVASLKDMRVLDDKQYAEHVAAVRKDSRGLGKQRALTDLLKKRVAPAVAQTAIEKTYAGADEVEMIEAYLARKFRNQDLGALLRDERHLSSTFRRLRGAGFSAGNVIRVLKRYAAQAEQLEDMDDGADNSG